MRLIQFFAAAGLLALLGGCDGDRDEKPADRVDAGTETAQAPADGKAEDGRLSIKGPGFDLKVNIPEGVSNPADSENELLYPGSTLSGMHIEAGGTTGNAKANGGVELRFISSNPLETVAGWYRDPERRGRFSVKSVAREGGALVIRGSQKSDGDAFVLRLAPASGGGTEARMTLSDRG
jgi:hypothetical protein